MAIAEQAGMSAKLIGIFFVAFTVAIYAIIGYLSRTLQVDAYYVAGRQVPTVFTLKVMDTWHSLLDGLADMC
jgi:cation/acetate symporter